MAPRLKTQDMAYIAVFAALLAICAWISIPSTIPVTMQTFGVFFTLFLLGGRRGTFCVAVYLLLGAAGLPVFSLFRGGIGVLLSASGGYLLGFFPAALTVWTLEKKVKQRRTAQFFAGILSLIVCYTCGTVWYAAFFLPEGTQPMRIIFMSCVLPFIFPDILKLLFAQFLAHRMKKHLRV